MFQKQMIFLDSNSILPCGICIMQKLYAFSSLERRSPCALLRLACN
uniref:Uncharacterized protein n=1 Tax=Rhizophora mucronata TaxID=61149 RepID=A0A2P2PF31_RHIMU